MLTFDELFHRLNEQDESVDIEAKTAQQMGNSILETICAFSNEPNRGGGYILLGVRLGSSSLFPGYEVVGVPAPDKLQADLISQCASVFNVVIRPQVECSARPDGKTVLVVWVPEAPQHDKPVYIKNKGLPRGAFRRIGSADVVCTDDDVQALYQDRGHRGFDEGIIDNCSIEDLDANAIQEYRRIRAEANPHAPELEYRDEDLLLSLGCADRRDGRLYPTVAGVLLFGKRLTVRRIFSLMRLDYIRVAGREWVRDPGSRFDTVEILDPLMTALPRALNAILDDLPKAFHLPANEMRREDVPLLPRTAIREALVNAVMHRSYRHKSPVQIIRYANRLEIRNPGHSLVPDDRLGDPGSLTRNEKIAAVLHETRYAETKGSGIRSMRQAMAQASLSPPTFESDREKDTFVVTFLFHHFLNAEDVEWLGHFSELNLSEDEQKALVYARELGAINNASYRDINRVDTLVASSRLRHLRDLGLLEQKGKSVSTYYEPTAYMLNPESVLPELAPTQSAPFAPITPPVSTTTATGDENKSQSLATEPEAKPQGLTTKLKTKPQSLTTKLEDEPQGTPIEPRTVAERLGQRASPEQLREAILIACQRHPMSIKELSDLLGRTPHYLLSKMVRPMVAGKELFYTYPDNPTHPQQKYTTKKH